MYYALYMLLYIVVVGTIAVSIYSQLVCKD